LISYRQHNGMSYTKTISIPFEPLDVRRDAVITELKF
jgi:hypothetical protein